CGGEDGPPPLRQTSPAQVRARDRGGGGRRVTASANGYLRLDGRFAIVPGGARGIGLAICERLVGAGAQVAIWGRDMPAATKAAAELEGRGADVRAYEADVTVPASIGAGLGPGRGQGGLLVTNARVARGSAPRR